MKINKPLEKICGKENICDVCKGTYIKRTKYNDICPYNLKGGKYQGDKPIVFQKGRVLYECQKLIQKYASLGVGG